MSLPDFLVIGAARAATTSLHYYLDQHPGITMSSTKEPNFFAFDHATSPPTPLFASESIATKSVPDRAAYERLFAHAGPGDLLGEASPLYLYVREAPEQIARLLDRPRFLAVLRNPIDRAYSHFLHIRREAAGGAVEGFRHACEQEMAAGRAYTPYGSGTHVLRMGLYDEQLDRYVERFGAEALLTLTYEGFTADPLPGLHRICDHLGIARHDFDPGTQYNRSGVTRSRAGAAVASAVRAAQPRVKAALPPTVAARLGRLRARFDRPDEAPPIPPDLRRALADWFAPSVERLTDTGMVPAGAWGDFR